MANTKAVNFRADAMFYQKTKEVLADQKISVSDVLNAALRKIANGTVDPEDFVSSDLQNTVAGSCLRLVVFRLEVKLLWSFCP